MHKPKLKSMIIDRLILCLTLVGLINVSHAQMPNGLYGNEWIQYNQTYHRINISETGLYKINANRLQSLGINAGQVMNNQLAIYHMGEQVPVYVKTNNGQLDFVEFYAKPNNASFDKYLYRDPDHHVNPHYSNYTDTAAYFITVSPTPNTQSVIVGENTTFTSGLTPAPYAIKRDVLTNNISWSKGKTYLLAGQYMTKGTYEFGEGFTTDQLNAHSFEFTMNNISPIGPNPVLNMTTYAVNNTAHALELTVNGQSVSTISITGETVFNTDITIPLSNMGDGPNTIQLEGQNSGSHKYAFGGMTLSYPIQFNFENNDYYEFSMPASSQSTYLAIQQFNGPSSGGQSVILYDLAKGKRIQCYWDGQTVHAMIDGSSEDRDFVLVTTSSDQYRTIDQIEPVQFTNPNFTMGDFVIISHPELRKGPDYVLEYAFHKSSNGFLPVIYNVDELYNQFGYGVEGHPLAIKNFVHFIHDNWTSLRPEHIFLIGKGLDYVQVRDARPDVHFIPTFGYPASDNLMVAEYGSDEPLIPVGRLAASEIEDVRIYLDKMNAYIDFQNQETTLSDRLWRKKVVHLAGGASYLEQCLFETCTETMSASMESGPLGLDVISFSTHSYNPLSQSKSEQIDSLYEGGAGMISFFGHGTLYDFDYYLKDPSEYDANPKYPFFMAFACYAGNMYAAGEFQSEKYVLQDGGGTINFMSFVHAVEVFSTRDMATKIYDNFVEGPMPKTVGQALKDAIHDYSNNPNYVSYYKQMVAHYMAYHGDPSLVLFKATSPDYYSDNDLVSHSIDEADLKLELSIDVFNLGTNVDTTILVEIIHVAPNNKMDTSLVEIQAPLFEETAVDISYTLDPLFSKGLHRFYVRLDADDRVSETYSNGEDNNELIAYSVNYGSQMLAVQYPFEYAIVGDDSISLQATTTNVMEHGDSYLIQVDTSVLFQSPIKSNVVTPKGNLIELQLNDLAMINDKVYYWRVMPNDDLDSNWITSSFVYIDGINDGWNQSHHHQFLKNDKEHLKVNTQSYPAIEFVSTIKEYSVINTIPSQSGLHSDRIAMYTDGNRSDKCRCGNENGMYIVVIDPQTLSPWTITNGTMHGGRNCDGAKRLTSWLFYDLDDNAAHTAMFDLLQNQIPDGFYVMAISLNNVYGSYWDPSLVQFFVNQGADKIRDLVQSNESLPYIFFFQKNNPQFAAKQEALGESPSDIIDVKALLDMKWEEGIMTTPLIGPASSWDRLIWSDSANNADSNMEVSELKLYGINNFGKKVEIIGKANAYDFPLTQVDASAYPYIQLEYYAYDDDQYTPNPLSKLRVYGQLHNDLSLISAENYSAVYDTMMTDEDIEFIFNVTNSGASMIDSAIVTLQIHGTDKYLSQTVYSIPAGDIKPVQFNFTTSDMFDQHLVTVSLQLLDDGKVERNLLNNYGWFTMHVNSGRIVSVKEVEATISSVEAFPNPFSATTQIQVEDGKDILDGDIRLGIYNVNGQLIRSLSAKASGSKATFTWDGTSNAGQKVPTGTYYYRNLNEVKSMTVSGSVIYSP